MLNVFPQMVELTPGSQVFIYQNLVQQAIAKSSYKAAASFLLNCFYTNDELLGMNLAGANGKPYPDKHILGAIIGTVCQQTLKLLIIDYFMVGECVRFLFTSFEGSHKRTSE